MSFYKGKRGEKIRQLWTSDREGEKALRDWLAQNGFSQVSLTIFTYLGHYEQARGHFLRAHAAGKRKKSPAEGGSKPAADGSPAQTRK